jgi:hypothetical protein
MPAQLSTIKHGDDLVAVKVRASLQRTAAANTTITYQGLARLLALPAPNTIRQVTVALERLMEEDAKDRCPFIAALVISKVRNGLPAPGFFDCAHRLGRFAGDANGPEAWSFYAAELKAATHFWAASGEPGLGDRHLGIWWLGCIRPNGALKPRWRR